MGDEEREGAARSQNVVLQGPADARTMAAAMRPGVERSRDVAGSASPGCVVITPTVEQALWAAEQARLLFATDSARVVPVTQVSRARRVLAAGPVALVTGTVGDLLALRRESALRFDALRAAVIIGVDEVLAEGDAATLQALLGDIPAEAMRVVTIDQETPAVEAFLEAQMHRARRIAPTPVGNSVLAVTPSYLLTSRAGRADALRAILDAVDPPSLVLVATNDPSAEDARRALSRLGLEIDGLLIQVVRQPTSQHVSLVVLWDAPVSADALAESLSTKPVDAVALLTPEELPAFRRLTHGAAVAWSPPARKLATSSRVQRLRAALTGTLSGGAGASASELALLSPLLDTFDAIEIASAALRLYETALRDSAKLRTETSQLAARAAAADARGLSVAQGGPSVSGGKQRVFLAVGKRDQVRVGDIVGAVANEAGIDGDRIGSVEMFESHTTVELSAEDAARAVAALATASLRGRRLSARIDERSGTERGGTERGGSDRGGESGSRRPPRTFGPPRGERSERADRSPSRGKPPRGDARPSARGEARGGSREDASRGGPPGASFGTTRAQRDFGDRPARERTEGTSEWSQRGERMKNAKRPPTERTE